MPKYYHQFVLKILNLDDVEVFNFLKQNLTIRVINSNGEELVKDARAIPGRQLSNGRFDHSVFVAMLKSTCDIYRLILELNKPAPVEIRFVGMFDSKNDAKAFGREIPKGSRGRHFDFDVRC